MSAADVKNGSDKQTFGIEQQLIFLVDIRCPDILQYLMKKAAERLFQAPFNWILVAGNDENIVPDVATNFDMLPDSKVLVVIHKNNTDDLYFKMIILIPLQK